MDSSDSTESGKRKRPPFAAIPHAVLDVGLSAYEIAAFVSITRFANGKGEAFPSLATIAKTGGMSVSTAKRAVHSLVERGLLSVKHRRDSCGDKASNLYVIGGGVGSIGTYLGSIGTNGRVYRNLPGRVCVNHELDTSTELEREAPSQLKSDIQDTPAAFTPPTVRDVEEYARQKGLTFNAARFVDYHTSRGWMVGSAPMRDWKAAASTWASRERPEQSAKPSRPIEDLKPPERRIRPRKESKS